MNESIPYLDYNQLLGHALHDMVRRILDQVAKRGLIGRHHFVITFQTGDPEVELHDALRAQYPDTMTIVLQHEYANLSVTEKGFSVGLNFGGIPYSLTIPYSSLREFRDPHAGFSVAFTTDTPSPKSAWKLMPSKPKNLRKPVSLTLLPTPEPEDKKSKKKSKSKDKNPPDRKTATLVQRPKPIAAPFPVSQAPVSPSPVSPSPVSPSPVSQAPESKPPESQAPASKPKSPSKGGKIVSLTDFQRKD